MGWHFQSSISDSDVTVMPCPYNLSLLEEQLISRAKSDLNINHDIDNFQVQAIISLINSKNVILIAPCGAGKSLVLDITIHLLRIKLDKPNGLAVCLQPLNSILFENN